MEESIMKEIEQGKVKMKPRWMFVTASTALVFGLGALSLVLAFLSNLIVFSLRSHGPMGDIRYAELVSNFPWWALFCAVVCIAIGIFALHKYDFSYKKNFSYLVLLAIFTIFAIGFFVNLTGIDRSWSERPMMRGFYKQSGGGHRQGAWLRPGDIYRGER